MEMLIPHHNWVRSSKRISWLTLAVVGCALSHTGDARADLLDEWTTRKPSLIEQFFNGIAFGDGKFVAVGEDVSDQSAGSGLLITSSDGVTWTRGISMLPATLACIVHGTNLFVAVGDGGAILTSPDGFNWSEQESGTADSLRAVAYGLGQFVAVGGNWPLGRILTSPDGAAWTDRTSPETPTINSVTFINGRFIATVDGASLESHDGIVWTPVQAESEPSYPGGSVAVSELQLVSVGGFGGIMTSTNGLDWTPQGVGFYAHQLNAVAYGAGLFVAVGHNLLLSSSDGTNWVSQTRGMPPNSTVDLIYSNGRFLAVGAAELVWTFNVPGIATSVDGIKWNERYFRSSDQVQTVAPDDHTNSATGMLQGPLLSAAFGNDRYVVLGDITVGAYGDTSTESWVSTNAVDWTRHPRVFDGYPAAVAFGLGRFVTIGSKSIQQTNNPNTWLTIPTAFTSTDGVQWTESNWPKMGTPGAIAFGSGRFVAIGLSDKTVVSSNGTGWLAVSFVSTNGTDWLVGSVPASFSQGFTSSIAFGNGRFVSVGSGSDAILTSSNGLDWSVTHTGTGPSDHPIVRFGASRFIIAGKDLRSSEDGITWTIHQPMAFQPDVLAYGGGRFVGLADGADPDFPFIQFADTAPRLKLFPSSRPERLTLELIGITGLSYDIEESTDLSTWTLARTNRTDGDQWELDTAGYPRRFNRAHQVEPKPGSAL